MVDNVGQKAHGVLDMAKNMVRPGTWMEKIRDSKDLLIEIGIFSIAGAVAGFLFKRYSRYLIVFLVFVGMLFLLQKNGIVNITFNQMKINEFLGTQMPVSSGSTVAALWEWVKVNAIVSIGFTIGFLFGMRIG